MVDVVLGYFVLIPHICFVWTFDWLRIACAKNWGYRLKLTVSVVCRFSSKFRVTFNWKHCYLSNVNPREILIQRESTNKVISRLSNINIGMSAFNFESESQVVSASTWTIDKYCTSLHFTSCHFNSLHSSHSHTSGPLSYHNRKTVNISVSLFDIHALKCALFIFPASTGNY